MSEETVYPGINIQWPYSEWILQGKKIIETRNYPIPKHYLGKRILLIETPGEQKSFKARVKGIIIFTECFRYQSETEFYNDFDDHLVTPDSSFSWNPTKEKWGWKILLEKRIEPAVVESKKGIVFTRNVLI